MRYQKPEEWYKGYTGKSDKVVNPYVPYSYINMLKDATRLSEIYPSLIELKCIGKSVEGRDILLLRLGKGKEKMFFNGSHHAREYITSAFLMNMAEEYAYSYYHGVRPGGYDVNRLLESVTMLIAPMVDPDGVNLVQNGIKSVKEQDKVRKMKIINKVHRYRSWKANINGVDLNRNYPTGWHERISKVKTPSSEQYKGPCAASEPETSAIISFVKENEDISIFASYHTQGEVIYWADHQNVPTKFEKTLAKRLAAQTGFALIPREESVGDYGGGFSEWTRSVYKKPSFTIELCPYLGSYPYPDNKFDRVWKTAGYTGLIMAEEVLGVK